MVGQDPVCLGLRAVMMRAPLLRLRGRRGASTNVRHGVGLEQGRWAKFSVGKEGEQLENSRVTSAVGLLQGGGQVKEYNFRRVRLPASFMYQPMG